MKAKDMLKRIVKEGLTRNDIEAEVAEMSDEDIAELDALLVFKIRKLTFAFNEEGKKDTDVGEDYMRLKHEFAGHNLIELVVSKQRGGGIKEIETMVERSEEILFPLVVAETERIVKKESLKKNEVGRRVNKVAYYLAGRLSQTPRPDYTPKLWEALKEVRQRLRESL